MCFVENPLKMVRVCNGGGMVSRDKKLLSWKVMSNMVDHPWVFAQTTRFDNTYGTQFCVELPVPIFTFILQKFSCSWSRRWGSEDGASRKIDCSQLTTLHTAAAVWDARRHLARTRFRMKASSIRCIPTLKLSFHPSPYNMEIHRCWFYRICWVLGCHLSCWWKIT